MKKHFRTYFLAWLLALVLFNAVVFILPARIGNYHKFGGAFWSGYAFITAAFLLQLFCSWIYSREERSEHRFLNLPLIRLSYGALMLTLIVGAVCMAVPNLPNWLGSIICLVILALYVFALIKSAAASDMVEEVGQKTMDRTSRMRALILEAQNITAKAKTPAARAEAKRVYEALRYSDPVSSKAVEEIEVQISEKLSAFGEAVDTGETEKIKAVADGVICLIKGRNEKCKKEKI